MKVLLLVLFILPWQDLLQEAKQHYMNFEIDSCSVKVGMVREYCISHQGEDGVSELSADVENILGALAQAKGARDSAAVHYRNAYDCIMNMEDRHFAPTCCINLADVLRQIGKTPEAALWLRRALSLSDSLSIHTLDCAINTQLGQIYADLRNFSKAEEYFEAAEQNCEASSFDDYFLANARGNACFFNEDYERAISFFQRARRAAQGLDNEFNVKITELNLGESFLSLHNVDSAGLYIDSAYEFWSVDANGDESILSAIRGMKAGLALEKENVTEAEKWLSYGSGGPGTSPIYNNSFNRHMMEISAMKGDWKNAYEYSLRMKSYSDSLLRSILDANFAEAEFRYSRDTTILHQQIRIKAKDARISRMSVWILIIVLVLCVCVLFIRRILSERETERKKTEEIIRNLKMENLKMAAGENRITVEDITGTRFVAIGELVLFTYQAESRRWKALLKEGVYVSMPRDYRADKVSGLCPSFIKLNQGTIVNMDYIKHIGVKDQRCILIEPFDHIPLFFSRRALQGMKLHQR